MAMGRPRTFDKDKALEQALQVFIRKGYEGASLNDLTEAMGINPPSLYAAFGNKEALFRQALDRYANARSATQREAMALPTARESIERLMHETVALQAAPDSAPGCLVVHGALTCSESAEPIRQELLAHRLGSEKSLRERIERGKKEGDVPADTDAKQLARFVATVLQGTAVQAASGVSAKELHKLVDLAMVAFPPVVKRRQANK
jgi:AcrR family transcriptional regulator